MDLTNLAVNRQMPILRKNKMPTGIADLDILMEGGYRNPANIILRGPTGPEKATVSYHFVATVSPEEHAFIVCSNTSPQDVISKAATYGLNLSSIHFIDCYSATLRKDLQDTSTTKIVPGASALNDLSIALNEEIKFATGKRLRVVFDTLSGFVLYNSQDSMRKFLGIICGRLKTANATTLFLLEEGVHDKQVVGVIEQLMDERFLITDKGTESGGTILTMPDIEIPIPFKLGPSGLTII